MKVNRVGVNPVAEKMKQLKWDYAQNLLLGNVKKAKKSHREFAKLAVDHFEIATQLPSPINGSVSRASIADQYGCKSQVMSISASITMVIVLLLGTDLLAYLPVPVLTGIVMAALIGIIEIGIARKMWKSDKRHPHRASPQGWDSNPPAAQ